MKLREVKEVVAFKEAAEKFCIVLETDPTDCDMWLKDLLGALSLLYARAHDLPEVELQDDDIDIPDSFHMTLDDWRRQVDRLHDILGSQTYYWAVFDPSEPKDSEQEAICGDIADDLADIIGDLKPGLRAWASGIDGYLASIVFDWKTPLFGSHWGIHAVSAMRALHPMVYLRGLHEGA